MNHKQIGDLKVGDRLQLTEDYIYRILDVGKEQVITKGSIIDFKYPTLGSWNFEFEVMQSGIFPLHVAFGRARLLKLKVKKLRVEEGQSSPGTRQSEL